MRFPLLALATALLLSAAVAAADGQASADSAVERLLTLREAAAVEALALQFRCH